MAVEIGSYLVEEERAKLVVVACNSAAAAGLPRIAEATGIAVVGVIAPAARQAARATKNKRVGLLATPATVASGAYERARTRGGPRGGAVTVACPKLAPLIQEGGALDPQRDRHRRRVLRAAHEGRRRHGDPRLHPLPDRARRCCSARSAATVTLVSSGQAIADEVERELSARGLDNEIDRRGTYRFLCTGDPEAFRAVAARSLGLPVEDVRQVDLGARRWPRHEAERRPRTRRAAPDHDRARLHAHRHRLGADLRRRHQA